MQNGYIVWLQAWHRSVLPCLFLPPALSVLHWVAAPSSAGWPDCGGRSEVKSHLRLQRGLPCRRRGLGQPLRHLHPLACKCKAVLVYYVSFCKSSINMFFSHVLWIWTKSDTHDVRQQRGITVLCILLYYLLISSCAKVSSRGSASRNTMTCSWQIASLIDLLPCG